MRNHSLMFLFSAVLFLSANAWAGEPLGVPDLEDIEYPDGQPPSKGLIDLGKVLFFDTRLSNNDNISCASCHNPDLGFGEGIASGVGTTGNRLGRNTPHLYNLAWNSIFFWDGRSGSLEDQALGPIAAGGEMNMPLGKLVGKLKKVPSYIKAFDELFPGSGITKENLAKAIAAFERTIITRNSAFDRYMQGDKAAMSPAAVRGKALFEGKANCIACHGGANFTDESFHNIGIGDDDPGRAKIVPGAFAKGAFKTPGLRNVLLTAPYMHDGSHKNLEEVIRHYNNAGSRGNGMSPEIKPLHLREQEIFDLVAFLGALTEHLNIERPEIP